MRSKAVEVGDEAKAEVREAYGWYAARSVRAAAGFVAKLDMAIERIGQMPETYPVYEGNVRRYVLRGYPYSLMYELFEDVVYVLAVAHAKRRPGYWKGRSRPPQKPYVGP